jgi:ABC-type nitrate/sulfonate/bicarbonate transport system substrate-binding protein
MKQLVRFVAALGLVWSYWISINGGAQAQTTPTVTVSLVKNLLAAPDFVAMENGYWTELGLDVRITPVTSGPMVVQALQAGDADLGNVAMSEMLPIARASGDRLIGVLPYYNDPAYIGRAGAYAIVGRKDRGIDPEDPKSLLGKKIGFTAGSDQYYLKRWFSRENLDIGKVELVSVQLEDMPASLAEGAIDAAVPCEPYASQVIRELGDNAATMSRGDTGLMSDIAGIVGREDWIRDNADIVEKFAAGIARATRFIREKPRETAEIVSRTLEGVNPADAAEGLEHMAWDPRISICTVEGSIRGANDLARSGQIDIDREFVAADFYDLMVYVRLAARHPELFEGLPPIPARLEDCQGKLDG